MRPRTSPLAVRVVRTIRRRELVRAGDRVAVAISGGPDSVALTWLLHDLARDARWSFVGLIHVNHGLRAEESDGDEDFCRALARRLDLPIVVTRVDVRAAARAGRQSLEAAARVARYAAFEDAAAALGATRVATGHTQDDQAETVLLRLFRGASSRGVAAIRPKRGIYIRPLIDARRHELASELALRGEAAREDTSNRDETIPRNFLRHGVLPIVTREWKGAVAALARFAELASDDERFLADTAREVEPALAILAPGGVQQIDARGLAQLPAALSRRIIRTAIEDAGGAPRFRDVQAVLALAKSPKSPAHLDLNGLQVEKQGWGIRIGALPLAGGAVTERELPVPGLVVTETGVAIQASISRGPLASVDGQPLTSAVLQADALELPLKVRGRRAGDRLRPFGASGTRKLQDLFVDRKVPRGERDRVPLVVDRNGRIVWVVGHAIADECRVTSPEGGMVILQVKKGNQ